MFHRYFISTCSPQPVFFNYVQDQMPILSFAGRKDRVTIIGKRGLVVGRWTCNPEAPGSNPTPCHWMDLSSVAPNSNSPRCVNSQLVSLPPVGILNLLCLICTIFVFYAHLNIFTWNLRDINVYYYYYYMYD